MIFPQGGPSFYNLVAAATTAAVVLALVAAWLSSAHGKRLAVLFGVVAFSALLELALQYLIPDGPSGLAAANLPLPACEVLVLCVLAAIIYRTWRRGRSAAGGPGGREP